MEFDLEHFGENTVIISAVPAHFPQKNIAGILRDTLDERRNSPQSPKHADEEKIAKIACKAAVKAHYQLTELEIQTLAVGS